MKTLLDSVQYLKGVGPKRAELLNRLGIHTLRDLLYFIPRDYEDRSQIAPISKLRVGERATIKARVIAAEKFRTRRGRAMARIEVEDASDRLLCVWFNSRFLKMEDFPEGREMLFTGRVDHYKILQMVSPSYEPADEAALFGARILPIYPLTEDLNQNVLRKITKQVADEYTHLAEEIFDESFRSERKLPAVSDALRAIHYPDTLDQAAQARRRLAYEELFMLQTGMALRRRGIRRENAAIAFEITQEMGQRIRRRFPFQLTSAQERAIVEIENDLRLPKAMNRMLQGDVGSGKTVVALYAMLLAVANRCQAALMAPTEILAAQHFQVIQKYLTGSRVRTELVIGGRTQRERAAQNARIAAGEVDIIVGTHALVESDMQFKRLALVVVDEQHKFGVLQRAGLRQKGKFPHVLLMTATPIPRTLALTVFSDLDSSILDELPPGRQTVKTLCYGPAKLKAAYEFIRKKLTAGEQAFVVYPLVEESENSDLKDAISSADHLQRDIFPEFKVGLMHGRMQPQQKDKIMADFRAGRNHLLVSTVLIEVGIDIPNATIMVVEHAERFGLAQLHQLRGRIGRGSKLSWFLLFAEPKSEEAQKRLNVICSTSDGFRIAEEDLKLRGPGDFFGTRQHGLPELRVADILTDHALLRMARRDAFNIVASDPDLAAPEHAKIKLKLNEVFKDRLDLINVG